MSANALVLQTFHRLSVSARHRVEFVAWQAADPLLRLGRWRGA
jgi:hypothetical protein